MFFLLLFVVLLSTLLTLFLRRYALAKNVMDVPNHRSAHTIPTPRGGGVAFVISILLSIPLMNSFGYLTPEGSWALLCAGTFVATLGFLDDHGHLNVGLRLLGHSIAAILALYWMSGFPSIELFHWTINSSFIMNVFGFFYFIWLINLYNFMDGIDGLAASEAIFVCLGSSFIYWLCQDEGLTVLPLMLAASVGGFLIWNWPPARIFMGDAGSGFLGFVIAVLSLQATHMYPHFFWSWLILLGVFITDATVTLLRRMIQKDRIYEAHATHAYQKASRYYHSHLRISSSVLLINLGWLFPLAVLVGIKKLNGTCGFLIAYIPLVLLAIKFEAGKHEKLK